MRTEEMAEELAFRDRNERERRGLVGPPTEDARRHKIVVEMTDQRTEKSRRARYDVIRFIRKDKGKANLRSFYDTATEADIQHVESLLGIK